MSNIEDMISEKNYLDSKVKLLKQMGMTDTEAVKSYLAHSAAGAETESKRNIRIDNAARKIMNDYFDGDYTFVKHKKNGKYYHTKLVSMFPRMETLYEDVIVEAVGEFGLEAMRRDHCIETCAVFNNRKLYAI